MKLREYWEKFRGAVARYDETHNFTCDVCDREVFANERVCASCMKSLPWNNNVVCPLCGRKIGEPGICLDCKEKPLSIKKARSCFVHEGEAARLVVRFKRGQKYLFRTLAELMLPLLKEGFGAADAITFVPMTERAEKERGYNQSFLLAEELAKQSGIELLAPAVKRRETAAQKFLGRKEREENLKGCFHVKERKLVRGRKLLIIDDTMTTGATADELSSVLLRAGARETYLLTVTSVPRKNPFGVLPAEPPEGNAP